MNKEKSRKKKAESRTSRRDKSKDLSRKRYSRDLEEDNLGGEKVKCSPKEEPASYNYTCTQRSKPKRDSSKKNQKGAYSDTTTEINGHKQADVNLRSRSNATGFTGEETCVKPREESSSKQKDKVPCLVTSSYEVGSVTSDSFDYSDSLFKPYMNSGISVSSRRSIPLRLQSLPYGGYTREPNDLNKN